MKMQMRRKMGASLVQQKVRERKMWIPEELIQTRINTTRHNQDLIEKAKGETLDP